MVPIQALGKKQINQFLWDSKNQIYKNRDIYGKFMTEISPTSFFPLLAYIPDKKRAEIMIQQHFSNKDEFGGEYVLPSISRQSNYYQSDGDYWRGRIWPPLNFLVYK